MNATAVVWLAGAAVLGFWVVGAYNRLVALRNQIVALFAPVDDQLRQRHQLLREVARLLDAATPAPPPGELDALHAALSQAEAACVHARVHPGAVGAIASLRLAEDVLATTRARLPEGWLADAALADSGARLAVHEASLDFTRRRFNEAVAEYNAAVRQFPTWIVAALFGFRAAAAL